MTTGDWQKKASPAQWPMEPNELPRPGSNVEIMAVGHQMEECK